MSAHRLADLACPHCGDVLADVTALESELVPPTLRPEPGAVAMCLACGGFTIFADDLTLRVLSDEQFDDLPLPAKILLMEARAAYRRRVREAKRKLDA